METVRGGFCVLYIGTAYVLTISKNKGGRTKRETRFICVTSFLCFCHRIKCILGSSLRYQMDKAYCPSSELFKPQL